MEWEHGPERGLDPVGGAAVGHARAHSVSVPVLSQAPDVLNDLEAVLSHRLRERREGSYTATLVADHERLELPAKPTPVGLQPLRR